MTKSQRWISLIVLSVGVGSIFQVAYLRLSFYEESADAIGVTLTQFNTITGIFGVLATVMYFFGGWFADRFQPRSVIAVALVITGVADMVLALRPGFLGALACFVAFAVSGMALFWSSAVKAVSLLGGRDEQGRLFGALEGIRGVASTLVGLATGAIISTAAVAWRGVTWSMVITGTICLISAAGSWFLLKIDPERLASADSQTVGLAQIRAALTNRTTWLIGGSIFMVYAFYSSFGYLDPMLRDTEGFAIGAGVLAFVAPLRTYAFQFLAGPIGGYLADTVTRSGPVFLRWALLLMLVGTVALLALPRTPGLGIVAMVVVLVIAFAVFACRGVYWSMVGELDVADSERGGVIGLASGIAYLPDAFLPFLMILFLGDADADPAREPHGGYPALLGLLAVLAVLGIVLTTLTERTRRRTVHASAPQDEPTTTAVPS